MTLIIVEIKRNPTFIQKSIAIFLNAWPGVWKWLQFLFAQCVAKNHHGQALMLQSLRIIPFIITVFGRDNGAGLRTLIIRTPGIFHILIPHWLQEKTDIYQDLDPQFNFSAALRSLLRENDHHDPKILACIVEAAGG